MGYRCPLCGKDFGIDKKAFDYHLNHESGACAGYAHAALIGVSIACGEILKSDKMVKSKNRKTKYYSQISPNHHWIKQNIISDEEGYDIVVCSRCGIKAKRRMSCYQFDMRQSMNKIENCID